MLRRLSRVFAGIVPKRSHTGYIPFEGRFDARVSEDSRLYAQQVRLNLTPLKRLRFSFDPFREDVRSIRDALHILSYPKVRATNPKCAYKTDITDDRKEPEILLTLDEGDKVLFKTANLTTEEIFYEMNRILLPLVPETVVKKEVKTKTHKKMGRK